MPLDDKRNVTNSNHINIKHTTCFGKSFTRSTQTVFFRFYAVLVEVKLTLALTFIFTHCLYSQFCYCKFLVLLSICVLLFGKRKMNCIFQQMHCIFSWVKYAHCSHSNRIDKTDFGISFRHPNEDFNFAFAVVALFVVLCNIIHIYVHLFLISQIFSIRNRDEETFLV